MGFLMEDSSGCLLLYKVALVFALVRWALSWVSRSRRQRPSAAPSSLKAESARRIRQNLVLTTYGEIAGRGCDSCAVCLSQLGESDEVRQLRNCSHVFHRDCIDRWVDLDQDRPDNPDLGHDCDDEVEEDSSNHRSCPLCRAPLLTQSQSNELDRWAQPDPEPSWAVERILYLFGDDLLY